MTRRPILTLTTDFGSSGSYVAQMKGVILGLHPEVDLVDVTHAVRPQDVGQAAWILQEVVGAFPDGTLHLVVVDPGVGTERAMVAVELGAQRFVGPDNGVLSLAARRLGFRRGVRLADRRFWREPVSNTFHGRDVMGPVAAHWTRGVDVNEFGPPLEEGLVELPLPEPRRTAGGLEGEVAFIDSFGNLITNIDASQIPGTAEERRNAIVQIGSRSISGIRRSYGESAPGTVLALIGSSGRLEVAVNQGSAAEVLGVGRGDQVKVAAGQ